MDALDAIPAELRALPQWLVWRYEERHGKPTKVPYRTDGNGRASTTDPSTWASFFEAVAAADSLAADGIGFVFTAEDPFVGVDLDETLTEAERDTIMLALDSYTERSVSGLGLHVLLCASLNGHRRRAGGFEVYASGRFFVMTGEHDPLTPTTIEDRQEQLDAVLAQYLPAEPEPERAPRPVQPVDLDDQELLERMFSATNGDEIRRLWDGDLSAHGGDHSRTDLALSAHLAFYTGRDPVRMETMFSASALGQREKWQRDDYRARTIETAISGCNEVYESSRPARDAVGTQTDSSSAGKGDSAIASPRPDVVGTRDETQSFPTDSVSVELRFVDAAAFADEDEPGADALVGDDENVLVPEGGDVMFYGDGGAGKTTLMVDLAAHLAAADDWLTIRVGRSARVGIVENEGPRPLFRRKVRRKLRGWKGSPIAAGQLLTLDEPWGKVSLDDPKVRAALAAKIATLQLDALLLGPVTRSGMNEAGTLQQVRDYVDLLEEVRAASGRRVTFLLAHHENRGGQVSGAWEGAVDTLFHVQAQGNGQTRLFVQKARWSPEHHKQKMQLAWADGEGFEVIEEEERDDNAVADEILDYVLLYGGTGWNKVDEFIAGKGDRLRAIRDNLLAGGRLVNLGTAARMKLWNAADPALPGQTTVEEGP